MAKVDELEARRLYVDEGLSLAECARRMGVSNVGVRGALRRQGVRIRSQSEQQTKINAGEAIRLYVDERLSLEECGQRLGVTGAGVRVVLLKNGIRLRSQSEQQTKIDVAEATRLYVEEGLSIAKCAERLGFDFRSVYNALRRNGVDTSRGIGWRRGKSKGRLELATGYVMLYMPDHPEARHRPYVFEHRVVMEQHLGRRLGPEEVVHHINGNRADNRVENLEVFPDNGAHMRHEFANRWARHYERCQACGTTERRHEARGLCWKCNRRAA